MRFFGTLGGWLLCAGILSGCYVVYNLCAEHVEPQYMNVLITTVFLFWAMGIQIVLFGLVASLIVRTGTRRGGSLSPFLNYTKAGDKEMNRV